MRVTKTITKHGVMISGMQFCSPDFDKHVGECVTVSFTGNVPPSQLVGYVGDRAVELRAGRSGEKVFFPALGQYVYCR
jgi:hypothetical protein